MKNNKVPPIRFSGFSGDWREHKFGEIVHRVTEISNDQTLQKVNFEDIISGEGRLKKDSISNLDLRRGTVFESNDILFGKLRPYLKNWLFPNFRGIAIGDFWVFRVNDCVPNFVYSLIQTPHYQTVSNLSTGTKMPRSDWNTVSNSKFMIPLSIDEQTQIGNFFKQLYDTIAFHQKELEQLKECRQGFLHKMFPREGSTVPQIRFPYFSGNWDKHKLGDIFKQTCIYVNPQKQNIELCSLTIDDGLTPKTARYNREFLVKKDDKFKAVKPLDFVYNPMNMTLGAVGFNDTTETVAVSGYYITMKANEGWNHNYLNTWLKSPLAIRLYKSYATGSLIEKQRVQYTTFSKIEICIPPYDEQAQIGEFFKQLDDTIALKEREINLLKATKQAFLQKMFI